MITTKEIYKREDDGTLTLIEIREIEVPDIDLIKEKEEQLLSIYAELEALKKKQNEDATN